MLPVTLSEAYPHDKVTEFYGPYIGSGFMDNMIQSFFDKYSQKIPNKINWIIQNYPRQYRDERFRLQNWKDVIIEVEGAHCETVNGVYKFLGFKPTPAKQVQFTYVAVNSGWECEVVCQYFNERYGSPYNKKINKINIQQKGEHIITLNVDLDGEVTADKIFGYKHVPIVNGVLSAINFIYQEFNKEIANNES